jgi:Coenzyme PQQ synthesis protein D (PqqD)
MLPEATVRVPEDVLYQKLNEEMVLLDMQSGLYFGLNAVGARAWELLIAGQTLRGAEQQLLREFEVAPEVLRADLEAWLAALRQRKLIAFEEQAA